MVYSRNVYMTGRVLVAVDFPCLLSLGEEMRIRSFFLFFLPLLLHHGSCDPSSDSLISRGDFPWDFVFGAGSSSFQVEGAAFTDGKKPSIWDTFAQSAGNIYDNSTPEVAADQYHRYKDDVKLMHEMGLDAYRFSISWPRLIPDGRGAVNKKGLEYYNNFIDELMSYGIEAHVTLYHFDLPQTLQDEYGGWISPKIIEDFTAYADVCFREFGDRVSSWRTFNEPNVFTVLGHDVGLFPPQRCSYPFGECSQGNSSVEVYVAAHNVLLSHASVVHLYRQKYQPQQRGSIGMTILAFWIEPDTNSSQDIAASERVKDFHIGWFLAPMIYGEYPLSMRKIVGSRLPSFSQQQSRMLMGSLDFIGLNHYSTFFFKDSAGRTDSGGSDYVTDVSAKITRLPVQNELYGQDLMKAAVRKNNTDNSLAWGLQKLLEYIQRCYKNPVIKIDENGYSGYQLTFAHSDLDDVERRDYLQSYIESLLISVRNGSNVKGYFVWSFLDCFELNFGYTSRFGLYSVNFTDVNRKRYPRLSARWYRNFLKKEKTLQNILQVQSPGHSSS